MTRTLATPFPATGTEPVWRSLGWTTSHRANVVGSRGANDNDGTGSGGTGDNDEDDDNDGGEEDNDDNDDDNGESGDDSESVYKRRMEAADRAKRKAEQREAELQKRLQALEDKDKSELEVTQRKLTEATAENEKLRKENSDLKLGNAFANVSDVEWKKPGTALKVARAEGYLDDVFNDDGTVDERAFAKKVKEFAKANPELLKAKDSEDRKGPTGGGVGSSGGKPGQKSSQKDLESKVRGKYRNLLR